MGRHNWRKVIPQIAWPPVLQVFKSHRHHLKLSPEANCGLWSRDVMCTDLDTIITACVTAFCANWSVLWDPRLCTKYYILIVWYVDTYYYTYRELYFSFLSANLQKQFKKQIQCQTRMNLKKIIYMVRHQKEGWIETIPTNGITTTYKKWIQYCCTSLSNSWK